MSEPDYVTVIPAVAPGKFDVVVFRWDGRIGEHVIYRSTQEPLSKAAADSLAQSWAAALRIEVQ